VGRGRFNQPIVGESNYQDSLRQLKENPVVVLLGNAPIASLLLVREPDNPYDKNAIAVLTEEGAIVGYLSREDALSLETTALEHEQRGEVMRCSGKLVGDQHIGVWLNLPYLTAPTKEARPSPKIEMPEYSNLDVCRELSNVSQLVEGHRPYSRSRPNWTDSRVAAIGEERYFANLEGASKGRCEEGERIRFKVYLIPDKQNPVDPDAVVITTKLGDALGYLSKAHAIRWGPAIRAFFDSGRVVCREAGLHQRTFKSGKRQFYLTVEMTDEEWLEQAADRANGD